MAHNSRLNHPRQFPLTEERRKRKEQARAVASGEGQPSYSKPWRIDAAGDIVSAAGDIVVDPMGSTVARLGGDAEELFLRHIVACVNACDGLTTEELEICSGLITWVVPQ